MKPQISQFPQLPGVYMFLNDEGKVLYIGKAKKLKQRLASYWTRSSELSPAKQQMIKQTADIDYTVVDNETEALLLEAGLIKKHNPPFNIVLRDDKNWTYIVITDEVFPRVRTVHGRTKIKGKYFGPFTSATAAKNLVRLIHQLFPLRTCKRNLSKLPNGRVCLQYHLGRCQGPCKKLVSADDYEKQLLQVEKLLKGQGMSIYKQLKKEMATASTKQNYEYAAKLRDKIRAWEHLFQPQKIISDLNSHQDVINLIRMKKEAVVTVMQIRGGQMLDTFNYLIKNPLLESRENILENFLSQYYSAPNLKPKQIITPFKLTTANKELLRPAKIMTPSQGLKKKLLEMAEKNAWYYYQKARQLSALPTSLFKLKKQLGLKELPVRIEAYDISNIQGQSAVGSMVVFTAGKKDPNQYRKFRIKTVQGANDVAMLREIIARRLNHPEWPDPQLVVLDGGKPQLNTVLTIIPDSWKTKVAALAKKEELLFLPEIRPGLKLNKKNSGLQLLQQLRDEAHRTAIKYYRLLHKKKTING